MKTIDELQAEIAGLKAILQKKDQEIETLEKAIDKQLSLFDVFNEAETFREPIQSEPPQESIIPEHKRRKAKRGSKFNDIPVEVVEYKLDDSKQVCDNCHSHPRRDLS